MVSFYGRRVGQYTSPMDPMGIATLPVDLYAFIDTWNPNDPCFDWKRPLSFVFRGPVEIC